MYTIIFAPEVLGHLQVIGRKYHSLIQREIASHLKSHPDQASRNQKILTPPSPYGATWELRCGPNNRFRIFYEIDSNEKVVYILAIGVKEGNRLRVGGEEYRP